VVAPLSGRGASRAQPSSSRSKGDRWPILTVRNPGPALSREHTDSYEAAGPGGLAAAKK
jgi:hypothetical protein